MGFYGAFISEKFLWQFFIWISLFRYGLNIFVYILLKWHGSHNFLVTRWLIRSYPDCVSRGSRELVITATCINVKWLSEERHLIYGNEPILFISICVLTRARRKFYFLDWNKEQSATLEHDQNKNVFVLFQGFERIGRQW